MAASVSTLGGLLFGYDNIVISGAIGYLRRLFDLDPAGTGWAAGCALLGCIVGCAFAGTVADHLGKKKGLALCAVCFALSSGGIFFASSFHQFVVWRLIGGLGIGAASVISPNYIAEIAPTRVRGRCVTLYQLGIVVGILAAVFVNMLIQRMGDEAWNTNVGWRWMFFAGIVPALLFGGMILPAVESPRWLMKMGRREQAIRVLTQINDPDIAQRAAAEIENSLAIEEGHISELFTTFRRPLLLGIMLAGLQQISGITPLFSFLSEIFRSAGSATGHAFFQSVLVSLINLLFTLFALWLVDRAGRKSLILAGTTLQCLSFALAGWFCHIHGSGLAILVLVMSFVAGHAFGNGVACWVIISEIYPTKVRGRGMSIATTALWLVGYLGNQLFPIMQKNLGSDGTFWCFSAGALLTIILVAWLIPETKGRSLEEITRFWNPQFREVPTIAN
ncbi:MAG TPA: sugar porter family MFS transporter [Candidatus Polarisedimenticolia bacterium]|nr:sugar porter family MFS transporter [Candidatus Polarisedimenticolia bacterium]